MILVLTGTADGRQLAYKLMEEGIDIIVSVATVQGAGIFGRGNVVVGKMDDIRLKKFIIENNIKGVIDATHPFATMVSENAMSVCRSAGVPYIRFERPMVDFSEFDNVIMYDNYEDVIDHINSNLGNVLLTVGINNLKKIVDRVVDKSSLYVRIMKGTEPDIISRLAYGVPLKNIIEADGTVLEDENYHIFKKFDIKMVVSKDSGVIGGVIEKINAAKRAGADVIILKRPTLEYPRCSYDFEGILEEVDGWNAR